MLYLSRHLTLNESISIEDLLHFLDLIRQGGYDRIQLKDAILYHQDGSVDTLRNHIHVEVYAE